MDYRKIEVMAIIVIYVKGLTYLKMVDKLAPLIDTVK
mgnify:CR=1 FL=1